MADSEVKLLLTAIDKASGPIRAETEALHKLDLALHEASESAHKLSEAEHALRTNTDAQKQSDLTGAVLKARVANDQAGASVRKYAAELDGLGGKTGKAASSMGVLSKASGALNSTMGALGVTLGAAAIVGGLVRFGQAAVKTASDVEESNSKFAAVFKDSADSVEGELSRIADSVNRSKYDLMGYAASVQDTFVPLGFAREQAAGLSVELTKLAVDLASFNNASEPETMQLLTSALVGNHEAVRRFGIVITETTLKEQLMTMGASKLTGAALEQAKVQARLNIIMNSTSDAQGDAARTADSYANVSRELGAAIKDLGVAIGNKLIPAMSAGKKEAAGFISTFSKMIMVTDSVRQAQEDGILTQEETNELLGLLMEGAEGAADAEEILTRKILDANDQRKEKLAVDRVALDVINQTNEATRAAGILTGEAAAGYAKLSGYYSSAAVEAAKLKMEQERINQTMQDFGILTAGALGKELEGFNDRQAKLKDRANEIREEIKKLGGSEYVTPAQAEKIDDLHGSLGGVWSQIQEVEKSLEEGGLNKKERFAAAEHLEDLKNQAGGLEQEIERLGGKAYLTPEQKKQLDDLRGELDEQKKAIRENASEHELAARRIALSYLEQAAAINGLTEGESNALMQIAESWGLIDPATKLAWDTAKAFFQDTIGEAGLTAEQINQITVAMEGIPAEKTVRVNVIVTGNEAALYAQGYDQYVPAPGYTPPKPKPGSAGSVPLEPGLVPGQRAGGGSITPMQPYWVAERGPEPVVFGRPGQVVSHEDAMKAIGGTGQTVVYNDQTTNIFTTQGATALGLAQQAHNRRQRLNASM